MSHVYMYCTCSAPSELFVKSFVSGRIYICKGRIMKIRFKRIHTVPCSIEIVEEYWARESPFKRITLMSDRFFLTLCENTVMFVSQH